MNQKIKQDVSIGDNLRYLRKKAGYSQDEVAAKLQIMGLPISREIISQMELGKYNIRISVLKELTTLYHASYEDFFKGI